MIKPQQIKANSRGKQETLMFQTPLFCVVFLGLKIGIIVAITLSVVSFLDFGQGNCKSFKINHLDELTKIRKLLINKLFYIPCPKSNSFVLHASELEITASQLNPTTRVVTIHGNCFYASLDQLLPHFINKEYHLILAMEYVAYFDMTVADFVQQESKNHNALGYQMIVVLPNERFQNLINHIDPEGHIKLSKDFRSALATITNTANT